MDRQDVLIRLTITKEEAEMFRGRWAMIVPLSSEEADELRAIFNVTHDTLRKIAQALSTLGVVLDTRGSDEPDVRKVLDMWLNPTRQNEALMGRGRELLGRAKFVGGVEDGKDRAQ
ncbi:hypothetical protein [Pseudotabrizicola algicola]|uniref:Uncharacterized protein n=1 Tax=Pseudotabrizicola algicola TaxID=2709381 RepID=A0A6B3RR21_9RHOB|nr:hypothetical protein [Pseudotabrizicola algicola]NEX47733.1 hypothetical protein [Pseudotabrizicola algicola]